MKLTERQIKLILQAIGMAILECDNELKKSVIVEHRDYWESKRGELYRCNEKISSLGVEKESE